jgi:exosome complex RNA-binding protein Rrp42 (RNase PH superfamily)
MDVSLCLFVLLLQFLMCCFVKRMEIFREIYPTAFHTKYLEHSLRPDGRGLEEARPVSVSTAVLHSTLGSSFVKLGRTTVMVGVKGEMVSFCWGFG